MKVKIKETGEIRFLVCKDQNNSENITNSARDLYSHFSGKKAGEVTVLTEAKFFEWAQVLARYERVGSMFSALNPQDFSHVALDHSLPLIEFIESAEKLFGIRVPKGWDEVTPHLDFAKIDFVN